MTQHDTSARGLRSQLDAGKLTPDDAIPTLIRLAHGAPVRSQRLDACQLLGDIAGRAFGAGWEAAERAAFALLGLARQADAAQDRRGVVAAMGRAFRNAWLLPFVHRRLSDHDPSVVAAAINAAGGLGFPALEEAVAGFLDGDAAPAVRRAAIAALGRMGAMTALDRLVAAVDGDPDDAAAALAALTEIRSGAAVAAAAAVLEREPEREVRIAAVRYLAELGAAEVLTSLRRLARDEDPELRLVATFASRTLKAERDRDAGERFLVALTERDRAVRAVLARRLRTMPIAEVLEHAEMLVADDAAGVIQVLGELREPEVTRYLLDLAGRDDLDVVVRARAIGAIEANLDWERAALGELAVADAAPLEVRAAAAQTLGAFASPTELFDRIGALAAATAAELRGAFLWALQLAVRPGAVVAADRKRVLAAVKPLLADADVAVRRRAAYVAGNLELAELAPALVALAKGDDRADVRLAAYVGLAELATPAIFDDVVALARKEDDPAALAAASRALAATLLGAPPDQRLDLSSMSGKLGQLLKSDDALVREAAVRLAGVARGGVPAAAIAALTGDEVPAVRAEALTALGRVGAADGEKALLAAFEDPDPALHERAAEALLSVGGRRALERVLAFVSGEGDAAARAAIAPRIVVPPPEVGHFLPQVDNALERVGVDDAAYEPLLTLKVALLEAERAGRDPGGADPGAVDAAIAEVFPSFAHMVKLQGFEQLVRSVRTAEGLYRGAVTQPEGDQSPPIVLWMKVLENYVHAWLSARMSTLQRDPVPLFEHVDRLVSSAWPKYQQYVGQRWQDPMQVGQARVELPVRSLPNALRELQERRRKRLDSPLSITEWSRLMVFFAVDHPSGVKNLFKLPVKNADQAVRLAHRLHTLAAVRNLVTHRAAASATTLEAFRRGYYTAFEDLAQMA
ncbi:MAG: HEAT repeat domain-containing protein [Kofleriaceae bacterium]|nr:HEAT repeat domain-containing protein [Kofleriaceae bacterium]